MRLRLQLETERREWLAHAVSRCVHKDVYKELYQLYIVFVAFFQHRELPIIQLSPQCHHLANDIINIT